MHREISLLEHKIGEKAFRFFCEKESNIAEVKEALFQFLGYVSDFERKIIEKNASKHEEPKVDAPPEVTDG